MMSDLLSEPSSVFVKGIGRASILSIVEITSRIDVGLPEPIRNELSLVGTWSRIF